MMEFVMVVGFIIGMVTLIVGNIAIVGENKRTARIMEEMKRDVNFILVGQETMAEKMGVDLNKMRQR